MYICALRPPQYVHIHILLTTLTTAEEDNNTEHGDLRRRQRRLKHIDIQLCSMAVAYSPSWPMADHLAAHSRTRSKSQRLWATAAWVERYNYQVLRHLVDLISTLLALVHLLIANCAVVETFCLSPKRDSSTASADSNFVIHASHHKPKKIQQDYHFGKTFLFLQNFGYYCEE